MASANRYSTSWEGFWSTLSGTSGEIFWDADPAHAAQQDLGLFQGYAVPKLSFRPAYLKHLSLMNQHLLFCVDAGKML